MTNTQSHEQHHIRRVRISRQRKTERQSWRQTIADAERRIAELSNITETDYNRRSIAEAVVRLGQEINTAISALLSMRVKVKTRTPEFVELCRMRLSHMQPAQPQEKT